MSLLCYPLFLLYKLLNMFRAHGCPKHVLKLCISTTAYHKPHGTHKIQMKPSSSGMVISFWIYVCVCVCWGGDKLTATSSSSQRSSCASMAWSASVGKCLKNRAINCDANLFSFEDPFTAVRISKYSASCWKNTKMTYTQYFL